MPDKAPSFEQMVQKAITINAKPAKIWEGLTNTELMSSWMLDSEITIVTDWRVGGPISIRGDLHNTSFENKGFVLAFEPQRLLAYSHLSSLSSLPDIEENYSIIKFNLAPSTDQTIVTLTLSNFPTEIIYKHLDFYWNFTLVMFKNTVER